MIQRIQTVFLLLAIVALALFLYFPLIQLVGTNFTEDYHGIDVTYFYEGYIIFLNLILAGIAAGVTLLNIFFFKKRNIQQWLCWVAVLFIAAAAGFVYYRYQTKVFVGDVVYTWWNVCALAAALFEILAFVYIRKDEELVKSLDRLR
ncbi:MAG: DUF4293 family protein [Chitinophagales bacterium]|nr:DUF4293 family protein [Chitinophagales bacterium]